MATTTKKNKKDDREHDRQITELLKLRTKANSIQIAIDRCREIELMHARFPRQSAVKVEEVLEYARRIAYTTNAPVGYKPGEQLFARMPPHPQEEHFLNSKLTKRARAIEELEKKIEEEEVVERERSGVGNRAKRRTRQKKLTKEEMIAELMKWKPGEAWPEGVPKPSATWKPGDALEFVTTTNEEDEDDDDDVDDTNTNETTVAVATTTTKNEEENAAKKKTPKQLDLDFDSDSDNEADDFDGFDFDVVSASGGDSED
jgi:hypothetical protein